MELEKVLAVAARVKGSDIHIKSGLVPTIRVDGHLRPIAHAASYTPEFVANTALSMMNERQLRVFEENREVNLSHTAPGLGDTGSASTVSGVRWRWCCVRFHRRFLPWKS